jgi:RHS repeat-associated protein
VEHDTLRRPACLTLSPRYRIRAGGSSGLCRTDTFRVAAHGYRYGFNGKEADIEWGDDSYDFGARIYDARVGRWLSVDPQGVRYSWSSPYAAFGGNPMYYTDPGGETLFVAIHYFDDKGFVEKFSHLISYEELKLKTESELLEFAGGNKFIAARLSYMREDIQKIESNLTGFNYWGHDIGNVFNEVNSSEFNNLVISTATEPLLYQPGASGQYTDIYNPILAGNIMYDPETARLYGDGHRKEPVDALGHEFGHFVRKYISDTMKEKITTLIGGNKYSFSPSANFSKMLPPNNISIDETMVIDFENELSKRMSPDTYKNKNNENPEKIKIDR